MPMDSIDRGRIADETGEMKKKREAVVAASPTPHFFNMRAQMLAQGRSHEWLTEAPNLLANLKVYASGGENGLHTHLGEDHMFIVMQGSASFRGPRGEERRVQQYEGVLLPAGSYYRFESDGDVPLVMLRFAAYNESGKKGRLNIYGKPLPGDAAENGQEVVIRKPGEFWGAKE